MPSSLDDKSTPVNVRIFNERYYSARREEERGFPLIQLK